MTELRAYGLIYVVTNRVNGMKYVGQTTTRLASRWASHLSDARRGKGKSRLHFAIRKYGADAFEVKVVEECFDRAALDRAEVKWVRDLGTVCPAGYNLTIGGGGIAGWRASEDIREKLSTLRKGRVHREETKAKIGAAHRGKTISADHIAKMLAARTDFRQSEAAKQAISRRVVAEGVEFNSVSAAAEALGVSTETISRRINSGRDGYRMIDPARGRRKRTEAQRAACSLTASRPVVADGVEYPSLTLAAESLGVSRPAIAYRIRAGMPGYARLGV